MKKKSTAVVLLLFSFLLIWSCKKDEEEEDPIDTNPPVATPPVNVDMAAMPYAKLSDYHFFKGTMKALVPNDRVLPYDVITPLFSDYAHKKRFVWMPEGVKATYVAEGKEFSYPNGAVIIKNFYYDHVLPENTTKIIETRIMYRKDDVWHFADYVWNEDQTEATFDLAGKNVPLTWIDDNGVERSTTYQIPAESECFTCHKYFNVAAPIGTKARTMNKDYAYSDGIKNQLDKWIEVGYLEDNLPASINTVIDWKDTSQPIEMRVRSYVDMNCAHCHRDGGHCDYRPLRMAFEETTNEANLGVCVTPQEQFSPILSHIIARGNVQRSMLYYRLNTTVEQYRMPLIGRTMIHTEAVEMFNEYISGLSPDCP